MNVNDIDDAATEQLMLDHLRYLLATAAEASGEQLDDLLRQVREQNDRIMAYRADRAVRAGGTRCAAGCKHCTEGSNA